MKKQIYGLRSFRNENGKSSFGIDKSDLEWNLGRTFPGFSTGRMDGRKASRFLSEKHFGGSGPGEALMRAECSCKEKPGFEPSFEVFLKKGPEGTKAQCVFELFPKSFDDGNGAGFSDGAEPMPDPESEEKLLKSGVDELFPLVRYKVSGDSETSHGFEEKESDLLCGGLFGENAERERHSRKHIQDDGDLEMKETEKSGHVGQVGHPDVTWVAGLDGARFGSFDHGSFGICRRWFLSKSAYGFGRDFPPGTGEGLSDELVPAEPEPGHGLDELTDDIGVSSDGRIGFDGGVLLGRIQGRLFPTVDGVARNAKLPGRLFGGESPKIFDPKDPVALFGRVMRAFSFGDLFPTFGKDIGHFTIDRSMKCVFFDFGITGLKGIVGVPELGDIPSYGEAEQVVGLAEST